MKHKLLLSTLLKITVLSAFLVGAEVVDAATLSVVPARKEVSVGESFSVELKVKSPDQSVNVVSGKIVFDSKRLSLNSISKSGSIVKFWIQEPVPESAQSAIRFEGVILNPGYTGSSGQVITVTFNAIDTGKVAFSLIDAVVLANDGLGTNVLSGTGSASIDIGQEKPKPPVVLPSDNLSGNNSPVVPDDLVITPAETDRRMLEIIDYPIEVNVGSPITIHGWKASAAVVVYGVKMDEPGLFSRSVLYESLNDGRYTLRAIPTVESDIFTATFNNASLGKYAFYAKDAAGEVTNVVFVEVTGSFWLKMNIFVALYWWLLVVMALPLIAYGIFRKWRRNEYQEYLGNQ
ncbi:MAG TPA: cohesin domain-containing protein [Candidatus Paceibacterota bacterium]|nr:cohesin domain-containing protein [Candidatus Paceibacterota bacterium]